MTLPSSTQSASASTPSRHEAWRMFDRIAHRYDLLNRMLSFGQDILWRSSVARWFPLEKEQRIVDIATGTADQLISILKKVGKGHTAIGIDMSGEMLSIGRKKLLKKEIGRKITLIRGDALRIPISKGSVDIITITFGIRNLVDVTAGLQEMQRILRPGGTVLILEFSLPENRLFRRLYLFYFRNILPLIGSIISGDTQAYRYLNRTVETFPYGREFCDLMVQAGFNQIETKQLNFGIATIYKGRKS